ncbi:hypothetical protein [Salinimicrobium oceani]|uniref:Uncharacterized protein n=1 Tax=Salinimicrobium oceani TaxID=2722702 RepID=A0ABX1CZW6_9FLAO|nr:hypothetical protein [Salinimicrobium oceani]NJW53795.1 hypothetical protein [Salinimicrobium oceani]
MFIKAGEKIKRKFGNVPGISNTKETARYENFSSPFFWEVLSNKKQVLNIKKMLSCQERAFTFRYEQLLRKSKILLEIRALKQGYPVHKMFSE